MKFLTYRFFLTLAFIAVWIWAAINPVFPSDWLLENILTILFLPVIYYGGRYFKFNNVSYTLITIFLILHTIGSHYTYAEVPIGYWIQEHVSGARNMYDRIVHFSFGLLITYPIWEAFKKGLKLERGFWLYYIPVDIVLASSALYEILEWGSASIVSPETGTAFLGAQGDIWDAQKDMVLAGIGAAITMISLYLKHWSALRTKIRLKTVDKSASDID